MVKAILRTKSIGTKVTEEEYARLEELAAAAGQSMSRMGAGQSCMGNWSERPRRRRKKRCWPNCWDCARSC